MPRVLIVYEPLVYADAFARVLEELGDVHIVDDPLVAVDVVLLSLDELGRPHLSLLPSPLPDAKLVAFSAKGTLGLIRLPGEHRWEELRPFGLSRMMMEVLAGRDRLPNHATPHVDSPSE